MSGSKQQQKNCCDSIIQRSLHVMPPKIFRGERPTTAGRLTSAGVQDGHIWRSGSVRDTRSPAASRVSIYLRGGSEQGSADGCRAAAIVSLHKNFDRKPRQHDREYN